MNRAELQAQAARTLKIDRRLICQWATGVGKSRVVLNFLKDNSECSCLILVPEQNNIDNWVGEFVKYNVPLKSVTIMCYASLHKVENTKWDLLVFDEAPHIDTQKRLRICKSLSGKYVLALGAVISDEERYALESTYGRFTKSVITLKSAVDNEILPVPRINVCHIQLNHSLRTFWYCGRKLTAAEMYKVYQEKVDDAKAVYDQSPTESNKQKMLRAGLQRKRFLALMKENAVKYICNGLQGKNRRFLCFCNSINQAENLCKERAFTSKTAKSEHLLEKFNNKEINSLFVVGKLIEGQNLVDIEHGVIAQLGGTERITVQAVGRIMRSKNPVIWIPVIDGTKDDQYLWSITSNIQDSYISHYNL